MTSEQVGIGTLCLAAIGAIVVTVWRALVERQDRHASRNGNAPPASVRSREFHGGRAMPPHEPRGWQL